MSDPAITIGFSTTNKLISRFIRWITKSTCSHAWISYYDSTLGLRLVLQAESWGYEARPLSRWSRQNILVAEYVPIGADLSDNLKWIASYLGSKYDYKAAILSGLWRWFGRWIKGKFKDPSKLMCSESVIRFLQRGEAYPCMMHFDPEVTHPKRIMERCEECKDSFRKIEINHGCSSGEISTSTG